jgi:hypothetical protein
LADYQARLIPGRPRKVLLSPEARSKLKDYPAINKICVELASGGDVSPWLSEGVRKRKTDPKSDMMFNDWQISHFHLGNLFVQPDKIARTAPLLFAHISANNAILLDVQPHGSWAMRDLLRVLLNVAPTHMHEIKGILGGTFRTDDEILELRMNGLNTMIEIDGRWFAAPGLGISSSRHAFRLLRNMDRLRVAIRDIRIALGTGAVDLRLQRQLVGHIGQPVRLGVKLQAGHLIVYDKVRGVTFATLPALQ